VQAGSGVVGEGGPQRVVQMKDETWGLQKWAWYPPREAEVDSGGWLERVEAGHLKAWASEPADLASHWLGETEDAPEELPHTIQEPEEEAGRPRPHGASSEAPREQVLQGGEREGSPGSCRRAQRQVDLSRRAGAAVSNKRKLPSGSERASEAKRRPAQRPSCEGHASSSADGKRPTRLPRESRACLRRTRHRLRPRRTRGEMMAIF
jgi:hypothetical protein